MGAAVAPILAEPGGARERELVKGEAFRVLETTDGHAFGFAERDGYVGYVPAQHFAGHQGTPTHRVAVPRTCMLPVPDVKYTARSAYLSFGSLVRVEGEEGDWARMPGWGTIPAPWYVPKRHLAPVDAMNPDPVEVAALFLGTPYLWGGNSAFGIDCSGLVQMAMLACGIPCPGDSDQQSERLGHPLAPDDAPERGDIWFWDGHVGILSAPDRLLHANGFHMATVEEPLQEAVARIEEKEGLRVTARRRP